MAAVTIRNLPDATHRALKVRAARNGRSTEAEIRAILNDAVTEPGQVRLGTLLREVGRDVGGADLDITRDSMPYEPVDLAWSSSTRTCSRSHFVHDLTQQLSTGLINSKSRRCSSPLSASLSCGSGRRCCLPGGAGTGSWPR